MKNLKQIVTDKIQSAIERYDWETAIGNALEEALDNISITNMMNEAISDKINFDIDFTDRLETFVATKIEDAIEELDLDEIIDEIMEE